MRSNLGVDFSLPVPRYSSHFSLLSSINSNNLYFPSFEEVLKSLCASLNSNELSELSITLEAIHQDPSRAASGLKIVEDAILEKSRDDGWVSPDVYFEEDYQ